MTVPWTLLRQRQKLDDEIQHLIEEIYGERGRKAIAAVKYGNVKRYRDFFIVVGQSDEYVVENDYCTCNDFVYRSRECWHIIAVKIARETGNYEDYNLWYQDIWSEHA